MHSAKYHGFQFHYSGDYSGDIKITDDKGFDWPDMEFERILLIITDPHAQHMAHVKAMREFVGEAVRIAAISEWEQMDTEAILNSPMGKSILEDGAKGKF